MDFAVPIKISQKQVSFNVLSELIDAKGWKLRARNKL